VSDGPESAGSRDEQPLYARDAILTGDAGRPCLYVFLDEGGNLDFSQSGTRFFTISSVTRTRPFGGHARLAELKYELIESGTDIEYFHASEDRQVVRDKVFAVIRDELDSLRIDSLVVEKRKAPPDVRQEERFYPHMVGLLLRHVLSRLPDASYSEVVVLTDALPVERRRRAMEKAVKETLAMRLPRDIRYRVLHHASKSNLELQVADYCNWAVFRKWERGDRRPYSIVGPAVQSEADVYQDETTVYY
jgi:hypothetical protein